MALQVRLRPNDDHRRKQSQERAYQVLRLWTCKGFVSPIQTWSQHDQLARVRIMVIHEGALL